MAFSTLSINLVGNNYNAATNTTSNSTTITLKTQSYPEAIAYVQNLGAWITDNNGILFPRSSILSIRIS